MKRSTLRTVIMLLGATTALVHLYLNVRGGHLDIPFTLNALGYSGLLVAMFYKVPFLAGKERLVNLAFIGFTVVTIIAWVAVGDTSGNDKLAIFTKIVEVFLIGALVMYLRAKD